MAEILIVDDDQDIAEILGELLEDRGHRVRIADNGESGLRELEARPPDLVLLDVEMPNLDGPGLSHQMLVRNCGLEAIPVVLLSGVVGLERVAARVGTPYFLAKPFAAGEVCGLVDRALAERIAPWRRP